MMADGTTIRRLGQLFGGSTAALGDGPLLARFVEGRDERAFEALVDRHGPMVWATCRAVLDDPHDAEDAFQAAFVALARRSGTVRRPEALAPWLHRVAYREAVRVGTEAARRRLAERASARPRPDPEAQPGPIELDEVRLALHAELDRLPESYRQVLVLCDLEGCSRGEAAHRLGRTEGSVRGLLERARDLLRGRLARRGLGAPAVAGLAALGREASAAIPAARATRAVRSALASSGGPALAWIRASVAALLVGSAGLGLAAVGRGGWQDSPEARSRPGPAVGPAQTPDPEGDGAPAALAGRVVGPDGRAVAGARIYRPLDWIGQEPGSAIRPKPRATSGPDGRFRFAIGRDEAEARKAGWMGVEGDLLALADGFGAAFAVADRAGGEVTLALPLDDRPIEGRIVDLEGRPVAGASVQVEALQVPNSGNLDAWIEAARLDQKDSFTLYQALLAPIWLGGSDLGLKATTDADGRFRLLGIGRERVANLRVEGPTIRSYELHAATREMPDLALRTTRRDFGAVDRPDGPRETFHGRTFVHPAAPTRPIAGTVRDKATGKPLAGVAVRSYKLADSPSDNDQIAGTTTDAQGRFRLVGMPRGRGNQVLATPPAGLPAFDGVFDVAEGPPGFEPVAVDLPLEHGIAIRGRVIDRATGRPVRASVGYHASEDNPHLKDRTRYPPYRRARWPGEADGSFEVVALPGPGWLSVAAADRGAFLPVATGGPEGRPRLPERTVPSIELESIQGIARIDPAPGDADLVLDLAVDSGREVTVRVLGPEGQPLSGSRAGDTGSLDWRNWRTRPESEFSIRVASGLEGDRDVRRLLGPEPDRVLLFRHDGQKLAGSVAVRGDEAGPIVASLQPWASARGRLVDAGGKPRPEVILDVEVADPARAPAREKPKGVSAIRSVTDASILPIRIKTGEDGRFVLEGLIPGVSHWIVAEGEGPLMDEPRAAEAGADLDLGDVRARPGR